MRVKSQWFNSGRVKTPQEIAGAAAFIAWRIGQNALKNMRAAGFDIAVGEQYFSFLSEFLVFLVQLADRIAYRHFGAEDRIAFTTALANRVAEHLAGSRADLMGGEPGAHKSDFIGLLNLRAEAYSQFEYEKDTDNFSFIRCLGISMQDVVGERDKNWVVDQIMASEAPEAVATLERAMSGLLGMEPKRRRGSGDMGD
jgi:hypothetical protein